MIRRPPRSTLFPTRRSSDLSTGAVEPSHVLSAMGVPRDLGVAALRFSFGKDSTMEDVEARSEEHTSELQSQSNLVCRLLLEKKKRHDRRCLARTASRTHRPP